MEPGWKGNLRYLVCLAVLSLGVDLLRQERMKVKIRRELHIETYLSEGLTHPSQLPAHHRALVFLHLGKF